MKISAKGMTRKQLVTILESKIRNDNTCITEGDMCSIFELFADEYEADFKEDNIEFTLTRINNYWSPLRMFLPRLGDKLKGMNLWA